MDKEPDIVYWYYVIYTDSKQALQGEDNISSEIARAAFILREHFLQKDISRNFTIFSHPESRINIPWNWSKNQNAEMSQKNELRFND